MNKKSDIKNDLNSCLTVDFSQPLFHLREKCPTLTVTFFSSDDRPHTDRSTVCTVQKLLKLLRLLKLLAGEDKLSAKGPLSFFTFLT